MSDQNNSSTTTDRIALKQGHGKLYYAKIGKWPDCLKMWYGYSQQMSKMDPAESFEDKLYDLTYTLICVFGEWKRAPSWEAQEAALRLARRKVST